MEARKPEEEIMIEDLKDLDKLLQETKLDLEKVRNKSRLIRSLLVTARNNLSEAIARLDSLAEDI
jgi:hypothetical protein